MIMLLNKEFKLAMHPSSVIMLLFAPMLMIPEYFYMIVFIYASMAVYFTCLQGRENNDVFYSLTLPVSKRDVVRARYLFAVLMELLSLVVCIPFAIMSQNVNPEGNIAGLDANITLFAAALLYFTVFNAVFFGMYYRNIKKIGWPFIAAMLLGVIVIIFFTFACFSVPYVRDVLDTPDSMYVEQKLQFLGISAAVFAAVSFLSCRVCMKNFEKQDI